MYKGLQNNNDNNINNVRNGFVQLNKNEDNNIYNKCLPYNNQHRC